MSDPHEHPGGPAACPAEGRRRPATAVGSKRSRRRQPRDVCPQRRRLPDPDHEAFVDWFVVYWRRNGAQLFTGQTTEKEAHEQDA